MSEHLSTETQVLPASTGASAVRRKRFRFCVAVGAILLLGGGLGYLLSRPSGPLAEALRDQTWRYSVAGPQSDVAIMTLHASGRLEWNITTPRGPGPPMRGVWRTTGDLLILDGPWLHRARDVVMGTDGSAHFLITDLEEARFQMHPVPHDSADISDESDPGIVVRRVDQ